MTFGGSPLIRIHPRRSRASPFRSPNSPGRRFAGASRLRHERARGRASLAIRSGEAGVARPVSLGSSTQRDAIGKADPIWWIGGRFLRLPRMVGGYRQRAGYYSRLRFIASRADQLWTASEFTAGLVRERFGVSGTPVPYCYDSSRFRFSSGLRRDLPAGPAHRFAARDPQESGSGPARGCRLIGDGVQVRLIGRGPEEGRAAALGTEPGRALFRSRPVPTIRPSSTRIGTASVAVFPSRFEGFGLGPIEALASGTPVVASDIPPIGSSLVERSTWFRRTIPTPLPRQVLARSDRSGRPTPPPVDHFTIPAAAGRLMA